jgi:phenylacetate-coenzyme A ligase PaaK-like adenylate-forming protein
MQSHSSIYQYEKNFPRLPGDFLKLALETFQNQYRYNPLYRDFANRFKANPGTVDSITQIPFLPVVFFKTSEVRTGNFTTGMVFESSGTTGQPRARHFVKEPRLYRESFVKGFEFFYGKPRNYCIIGLLPAYLEREGSSLVMMVDELIRLSGHESSGFYLYDFEHLHNVLLDLEKKGQPTILIGVSFALLDFAEKYPMQLAHTILMETGGMKGRRAEITRSALHELLKQKLGVSRIHSEYGMTELLSQAYSDGEGIYKTVPWMKVLVREEDDPLQLHTSGEGLLNIIDLANRDSCAFIATDDIAKLYEDGSFEILGRLDNSDIRGCSLLVV